MAPGLPCKPLSSSQQHVSLHGELAENFIFSWVIFSGLIQLGSFSAPCLAHGHHGQAGASGSTALGLKMVLRKLQRGVWAHTHTRVSSPV